MSSMTPREIVEELNRHIVGQDDAKRAVAIALRNRWRRMQLPELLQTEVTPKNILMIVPTSGQLIPRFFLIHVLAWLAFSSMLLS